MSTRVIYCGSVRVQVCVRSSSRGHAAEARLHVDTVFLSHFIAMFWSLEFETKSNVYNVVFPYSSTR